MAAPHLKTGSVREAVGIFSDADSLQAAIDEFQKKGFIWNKISVLASDATIEKKFGHLYERVEDLEDDPSTPRKAFVPRETIGQAKGAIIGLPLYVAAATATGVAVASGGTILHIITATILSGAAGGTIGAILAEIIDRNYATYLQKQIDRGGLLLWVSLHSVKDERKATKIFKKFSAHDIHIHNTPTLN